MADLPTDSAGELAAEFSGSGVRATVQTFSGTTLGDDTGTNSAVRTLQQTQGTPSINQNSLAGTFGGSIFQLPGVGAGRDDSAVPTSNNTKQIINASFGGPIKPQANVLDQYASYTYQLSWYLLTPEQFAGLAQNRLDPTQWQLLVQSGGAPATTTTSAVNNFSRNTTTGRNKFFTYDYYIDNLTIDSVLPLKGTKSANASLNIEFKLTEPNGISLLNNLYDAIDDLYKSKNISTKGDYLTAQYCLGIRFFGYDENGNLVQAANNQGNQRTSNISDPRSVVEKYYPFTIKSLTFRLVNRAIEYSIEGNPTAFNVGFSSDRGTIPFAYNLSGQTLDELFNGTAPESKVNTVEGRNSTAQPAAPISTSPPTGYNAYDDAGF